MTANEFLKGDEDNEPWTGTIEQAMIEFAKFHVKAALETASKHHEAELWIKSTTFKGAKWRKLKEGDSYNPLEVMIQARVNENSIIKAYPLENIK